MNASRNSLTSFFFSAGSFSTLRNWESNQLKGLSLPKALLTPQWGATIKYLVNAVPQLRAWADIKDVEAFSETKTALFRTFPGIIPKKSFFAINRDELAKFDGSRKGYEIASLVFDIYHEFYHVNVHAGKIAAVGNMQTTADGTTINPEEEFLANYSAVCTDLPAFNVQQNYFRVAAVQSISYLMKDVNNNAHLITYRTQIIDLLNAVPAAYKINALEVIKNATGVNFK
jgi:hypothetical protein